MLRALGAAADGQILRIESFSHKSGVYAIKVFVGIGALQRWKAGGFGGNLWTAAEKDTEPGVLGYGTVVGNIC